MDGWMDRHVWKHYLPVVLRTWSVKNWFLGNTIWTHVSQWSAPKGESDIRKIRILRKTWVFYQISLNYQNRMNVLWAVLSYTVVSSAATELCVCETFKSLSQTHLKFSQTQSWHYCKLCIFPYVWSFLLYFYQLMLMNARLEIKEYEVITFQGCTLHLTGSFLLIELKLSYHLLTFLYCG